MEGATLTSPPLEEVVAGDLLLVRPGEIVPVDGRLEREVAVLDESALTGESLPVERRGGDDVRSGAVNAGDAFTLRATSGAAESTYAGIVQLVAEAEAEASTAPFVRLADRYAAAFVAVSLLAAGVAWALSGLAVRAVAVLVVATPCPLILAAPIAITAGLSRAASRGVIIKGGVALERLAQGRVLLLDKTGTLTAGRPVVTEVVPLDGAADELLRAAASLDQVSPHVVAAAIVRAARGRDLPLSIPDGVEEVPGSGVRGMVSGGRSRSGRPRGWHRASIPGGPRRSVGAPSSTARSPCSWPSTASQREPSCSMTRFAPTPPAPSAQLRRSGIRRVVMVSGDRADVAEGVGVVLGVDTALADCSPADKVDVVVTERAAGPTIMVGDGINDAPALARADVGVAMGARGVTASSEAADVVLTVDRLDRLGEAIGDRQAGWRHRPAERGVRDRDVVRRDDPRRCGSAPTGRRRPGPGGNRHRRHPQRPAGAGGGRSPPRIPAPDVAMARRFVAEHRTLRPGLDRLRAAADMLGWPPDVEAIAEVRAVHRFLVEEIGPHEVAEGTELYPVLDRALGGSESTITMSRAHAEIARLIRRLGRVLDALDPDRPDAGEVLELRRLLYGLHAILRLHFAQEEEGYFSLLDEPTEPAGLSPREPAPARRGP